MGCSFFSNSSQLQKDNLLMNFPSKKNLVTTWPDFHQNFEKILVTGFRSRSDRKTNSVFFSENSKSCRISFMPQRSWNTLKLTLRNIMENEILFNTKYFFKYEYLSYLFTYKIVDDWWASTFKMNSWVSKKSLLIEVELTESKFS